MKNIILYGPPGAGKGTQAAQIVARLGYVQLSTGDLVRAELKSNPAFAERVQALIDAGQLVDQETIDQLVGQFLAQNLAHDIVFDGYPRTLDQAQSLDVTLAQQNQAIDAVIVFKIPDDLVIARIGARLVCGDCGKGAAQPEERQPSVTLCVACKGPLTRRSDDTTQAVKNRLAAYYRQTAPLLAHYQSKSLVVEIDAARTPLEVFGLIQDALAQV